MKEQLIHKQAFLLEQSENILKLAKSLGADQADVAVSFGHGLSTTVRLGDVETIEHQQDQGVEVTVYYGYKKGSASTTDLSHASIEEAVRAASNMAKFTLDDECVGIPEAADLADSWPALDLYHPWNIDLEEAILIAKNCEAKALSFDAKITNSEGANLDSYQSTAVYANSHGFRGGFMASRHSIGVGVIAEADAQMQRDYGYSTARDAKDLWNIDVIAKEAASKAMAKLHPRKVKTGEYPVIFTSDLACSIIGSFLSAVSGSNLYRESSFLLDSLGKQIFPDFINIYEDPYIKKGLASKPFDAEGVGVKARHIIHSGQVEGYMLNTYTARKLNMKTTGNAGGSHNIQVISPTISFEQLVKQMGTGLIVNDVIGQGVNIVTGDYSRGASGFWVENGEIQYPVEEITIAGNLKNMYQHITGLANDYETRGRIHVGSMLIDKMTVAGN